MQLKRFEAPTLREALRAVREALGPDALVLSTRSVRREGWRFGKLARPMVEVTAAIDRDAQPVATGRVAPDPSWKELRLGRALVEPLEGELRALRRAVERLEQAPPRPLAEELAEIRALASALARERLAGAASEGAADPEAGGDPASAGDAASRQAALAERLDPRLRPPREDDPPFALFVGPTGAGKTTTVAKLAAREAAGAAPALVSTDCHRAGGDAPLRSLARTLETSFAAATSTRELRAALRKLGGRRALVDTAGRSRSDPQAIGELARIRAALGKRGRVHLVLPAPTRGSDLAAELERYRPLAPDALVLTKLDECSRLDELAPLLLAEGAPPLAWIADGQRVPEDLHLPEPDRLAAQLLGCAP